MCGICGCIGTADERLIDAMTDSMEHRGPDGRGTSCFPAEGRRPAAALGHRRLSIIDPTERGAQPMRSADGRHWITYNGEIYNHRELRRDLEADGVRFSSDCDTEVLLAMYVRHGADMLTRLNGIYAFAIWDAQDGRLFLARDRLGVKPLYYAEHDGRLVFASEIKAMLKALPGVRVRPEGVADFLTFLWVPDPDTLFEGIFKLPPGHFAIYEDGRLQVRQWWDMTFEPDARGVDQWAPVLRDEVGTAVRRQMISDVPLGSFLSGGIDSSAIVAEMAATTERVTTYTVGFSAEDLGHEIVPDDVRYARQMAREVDADYHEQILEANVVDLLPKLVWHMDEPVADPACITTYLICRAARERLTVILSGMGGDEVFAGYPRHLAARIGQVADVLPAQLRTAARQMLDGRLTLGRPGRLRGPRRNLMKLMRGIDLPPDERFLAYCSYYQGDELGAVLSPELRADLRDHEPLRHHREYFDRVRDQHWVNQMLYVDMKTFLPCLNLTYTDKMSMAASTEVRVPLLDDELVALSGRIPPGLKLHRSTRKYVFKKSMEGTLPKEIVWRPKAGFGAPVRSWLVNDLRPLIDDALSPRRVRDRGLLDPDEVRRIIAANDAGTEDNSLRIWAMLTLELWLQTFVDDRSERLAA